MIFYRSDTILVLQPDVMCTKCELQIPGVRIKITTFILKEMPEVGPGTSFCIPVFRHLPSQLKFFYINLGGKTKNLYQL